MSWPGVLLVAALSLNSSLIDGCLNFTSKDIRQCAVERSLQRHHCAPAAWTWTSQKPWRLCRRAQCTPPHGRWHRNLDQAYSKADEALRTEAAFTDQGLNNSLRMTSVKAPWNDPVAASLRLLALPRARLCKRCPRYSSTPRLGLPAATAGKESAIVEEHVPMRV